MGPPRGQRRRLARFRWGHTVCTGYRNARRDHPEWGRLECHSELRVGGAAGCTTWLLYYRSREVICFTHTGRCRAHPRALWPQHSAGGGVIGLTRFIACSRPTFTDFALLLDHGFPGASCRETPEPLKCTSATYRRALRRPLVQSVRRPESPGPWACGAESW